MARANQDRPGRNAFAAFEAFWSERVAGREPDVATLRSWIDGDGRFVALGLGPGARFGNYRIERMVGGGGQGVVFRARDERLGRDCALKILHSTTALTAEGQARFLREGRLAARIDHPGVCPVYESGVVHGMAYLSTRWVDGEPLDRVLERERAGGEPESSTGEAFVDRALDRAISIGDALAAAHAVGVLHRDVKPGNVLIERRDGRPVLVDFGLAGDAGGDGGAATRLTRTGQAFGTPGYMAPEQCGLVVDDGSGAATPDERADVFALAVLTFELVTGGEQPFPSQTRAVYEQALRSGGGSRRPLRLPDGTAPPTGLDVVLDHALQLDPNDRLASVDAFVAELRRLRRGHAVHARRPSLALRLRRWARRDPALARAVGGVLAALVVGLVGTLYFLRESLAATAVAERRAYRSGLVAASASLARDDVRGAHAALEACPPSLRAWEWRWLQALVDPALARLAGGADWSRQVAAASTAAVAVAADGQLVVARPVQGERALRVTATANWRRGSPSTSIELARIAFDADDAEAAPAAGLRVRRIAIDAQAARVVVASADASATITCHPVTGGAPIWSASCGAGRVWRVAVGADGTVAALFGPTAVDALPEVVVLDAADGAVRARIAVPDALVTGFALAEDEIVVAVADPADESRARRGALRVFDRTTGDRRAELELDRVPDGEVVRVSDRIVCSARDGSMLVVDRESGRIASVAHGGVAAARALFVDPHDETPNACVVRVGVDGACAHFVAGNPIRHERAIGPGPVASLVFDERGALHAATALLAHASFDPRTRRPCSGPAGPVVRFGRRHASPRAAGPLGVFERTAANLDGAWEPVAVPAGWLAVAVPGAAGDLLVLRGEPGARESSLGFVDASGAVTVQCRIDAVPPVVATADDAPCVAFVLARRLVLLDARYPAPRELELDASIASPTALALTADGTRVFVGDAAGTITVARVGDEVRMVARIRPSGVGVDALAVRGGGGPAPRLLVSDARALHVVAVDPVPELLVSHPVSGARVRALAIDPWSDRIALGRADGSVLVLGR